MAKNGFGKAGSADKNMQNRWQANNDQRIEKMRQKAQRKAKSREENKDER